MDPNTGTFFVTTIDLSTTGTIIGILVGLVTIFTAGFIVLRWIIRSVVTDGLHENNSATRQVLEQVKNSHTTNLRQDIDAVMQAAKMAKFAADDAKDLAASASAAIHRTERKVDRTAAALGDHIAFSETLITEAADRNDGMTERLGSLEQKITDLPSIISPEPEVTP